MNTQRIAALTLAVPASVVAGGISVVAGLERGGTMAERGLWVGVGLVLALSAHVVPALVRRQSWAVRGAAGDLRCNP
jgi:hypothetical protein